MTNFSTPLLSVAIPTYKRPELLKRTLKSLQIKNDLKRYIEVVVCDNSDGKINKKIVEELLVHSGFKWKYNINNLPTHLTNGEKMVENFNMCVKQSSGKYIYIIHDDDYLLEGGLKVLYRQAVENEKRGTPYNVLMFGVSLVDIKGKILKTQKNKTYRYYSPKTALKHLLTNSSFVRFPSIVLTRHAYDELGAWDTRYEGATDTAMWIKMFSNFGVYAIPSVVAGYTIHSEADTNNSFNKKSIQYLLDLFAIASKKELLDEETIYKAKSNFFHQYVLGGTFRAIKSGDYDSANRILKLLNIGEFKNLSPSVKFRLIKIAFSVFLAISTFNFITESKLSESKG